MQYLSKSPEPVGCFHLKYIYIYIHVCIYAVKLKDGYRDTKQNLGLKYRCNPNFRSVESQLGL